MASADSLSRRRAIAAGKIERRVAGIARALEIDVPRKRDVRYPDAEHRQADLDERIESILTSILREVDPKAPELVDPQHGQINETGTKYVQTGDQTDVKFTNQPRR